MMAPLKLHPCPSSMCFTNFSLLTKISSIKSTVHTNLTQPYLETHYFCTFKRIHSELEQNWPVCPCLQFVSHKQWDFLWLSLPVVLEICGQRKYDENFADCVTFDTYFFDEYLRFLVCSDLHCFIALSEGLWEASNYLSSFVSLSQCNRHR